MMTTFCKIISETCKDNVINKEVIENDSVHLNNVIKRASIMNIVRLEKNKIIQRNDLNRSQRQEIKNKVLHLVIIEKSLHAGAKNPILIKHK